MIQERYLRELRPDGRRGLLCVPGDSWTVRLRTREIFSLASLYVGGAKQFHAFAKDFRKPEEFAFYAEFLWGDRLKVEQGPTEVERFVIGFQMRWLSKDRFFLVIDSLFVSDAPFAILHDPPHPLPEVILRSKREDGGIGDVPWHDDPDLVSDISRSFTKSLRSGKTKRPPMEADAGRNAETDRLTEK